MFYSCVGVVEISGQSVWWWGDFVVESYHAAFDTIIAIVQRSYQICCGIFLPFCVVWRGDVKEIWVCSSAVSILFRAQENQEWSIFLVMMWLFWKSCCGWIKLVFYFPSIPRWLVAWREGIYIIIFRANYFTQWMRSKQVVEVFNEKMAVGVISCRTAAKRLVLQFFFPLCL